jgi:hypothetical protein
VFVQELPATRAYGATRWLHPHKALLQLSLRGKSNDFLCFTFFHEAAHIPKHGKRDVFIEAKGVRPSQETRQKEEANTFASAFLIRRSAFAAFRNEPLLTSHAIQRFARGLCIAPGIVMGWVQHEQLLPFNKHNGLKRRLFDFPALDLAAGERVQWQLLARSDLRLVRLAAPPATLKPKKQPRAAGGVFQRNQRIDLTLLIVEAIHRPPLEILPGGLRGAEGGRQLGQTDD